MVMSRVLDFASGKKWVIDQLQSIANRYLNRSASLVARRVQATIHHENPPFLARIDSTPVVQSQDQLVTSDLHLWPTTGPAASGDETGHHNYVINDNRTTSGEYQ